VPGATSVESEDGSDLPLIFVGAAFHTGPCVSRLDDEAELLPFETHDGTRVDGRLPAFWCDLSDFGTNDKWNTCEIVMMMLLAPRRRG
jgi:hypothetical protein